MPSRRATDEENAAFSAGEKLPQPSPAEPESKDDGFTPVTDPESLQAIEKALTSSVKMPQPAAPPDCGVILPGGVQIDDVLVNSATVRELTGEHEEILAKAIVAKPNNIFHFLNVLLECGVERLGSEDPSRTKKLLKAVLVGDRDALIIGISRSTYGDEIDLTGWQCPGCGETSDLSVPLADIPVRELEGEPVFDVELRNGRKAEVRLANGADQLAIFENINATAAERDTALLARCLISITDADGTQHHTAGFAQSYARGLNAKDRSTIIKALNDTQPGPQFDGLKITHETCGEEVELLIGISDLFPGLRMV